MSPCDRPPQVVYEMWAVQVFSVIWKGLKGLKRKNDPEFKFSQLTWCCWCLNSRFSERKKLWRSCDMRESYRTYYKNGAWGETVWWTAVSKVKHEWMKNTRNKFLQRCIQCLQHRAEGTLTESRPVGLVWLLGDGVRKEDAVQTKEHHTKPPLKSKRWWRPTAASPHVKCAGTHRKDYSHSLLTCRRRK